MFPKLPSDGGVRPLLQGQDFSIIKVLEAAFYIVSIVHIVAQLLN